MDKRGAISTIVRLVVIIIIAIVILLLILSFIRHFFGESAIKMQEQLQTYAIPPVALISSPSPLQNYLVFKPILFDGSESYDRNYRIVGYFWDFDSDFVIDSRKAKYDHSYFEPGEYNATLKVINDQGAIGTASQIVRVVTNNQKAAIKNSLFLIRDNKRTNEDTILRLIPVTTWYDANGFHSLPYYVYYVEEDTSSLTLDQLKEIMDKYGRKHAYVFDDQYIPCPSTIDCDPSIPIGTGSTCCNLSESKNITIVDKIDDIYFDFWTLYEYAVLIDPDEDDTLLIASLFAAFYNSPIIFIDDSNLNKYKDSIKNNCTTWRVYYIPSFVSMDGSVRTFITDETTCGGLDYWSYSEDDLRTGRVNRIVELTSNVTMS